MVVCLLCDKECCTIAFRSASRSDNNQLNKKNKHVSLHTLKHVQLLPLPLEQAWDFFSSPLNLNKITPPEMNFVIRSAFKPEDRVYAGMLIHYNVSPLFHIPLSWTTEITAVEQHRYFIDEQRHGPFAFWHHQHFFERVPGGVKMTDIVSWKVPGWFLGDVVNWLLVNKRVEGIFSFRKQKLTTLFGSLGEE